MMLVIKWIDEVFFFFLDYGDSVFNLCEVGEMNVV